MTIEQELRGLEEQTADGHWNAYKARKDVVNAVLDEQDAQRCQGGWRRRGSAIGGGAVVMAANDALAEASRALSLDSVQKAQQRALIDAYWVRT